MYTLALDERLRGVIYRYIGTQLTPFTLDKIAQEFTYILEDLQIQEPTFPLERRHTQVVIKVLDDNELLIEFTPETRKWLEENI